MSSGATSVWTRAMQAAITWRAFIMGIVTWPRRRSEAADEAEKADMRAWILRDRMKHVRPEDAVRVLSNASVAESYARHLGVSVKDLRAHAKTLAVVIKGSTHDSLQIEGVPATSVSDLRIVDGSLRVHPAVAQAPVHYMTPDQVQECVRVMPVVLVTELFDSDTRRRIEFHGREELLEWAWVAESDWAPQTLRVGGRYPMESLRLLTHEMLREKQLPEVGPRKVMVRVRTVKNAVAEFEVDVNEPTWMVTMAVRLRGME